MMAKDNTAYNRRYRHKYPERAKAHAKINWAVRTGKMLKRSCEKCGCENTHAHHDDYSKPLDVRWLCHSCHEDQHHSENRPANGKKRVYVRRYVKRARKPSKRQTMLDDVVQLRTQGISYKAIATKLGISKSHAFKIANQTPYK